MVAAEDATISSGCPISRRMFFVAAWSATRWASAQRASVRAIASATATACSARALAAAAVLVNYLDGENCEAIASVAEGCFASRLLTACRAISEGPQVLAS